MNVKEVAQWLEHCQISGHEIPSPFTLKNALLKQGMSIIGTLTGNFPRKAV